MPLALKPQKRISEIDFDAVALLKEQLGCDSLFAQILYNRGFDTIEKCKQFLYPDQSSLLDPFSMKNMDKLVERIKEIKKQNKKITVYGDYDVDGICATAILINTFKILNINADYYIPNRHREGYGLNEQAVEDIFNNGTDVILTVDCGIASGELIKKFSNNEFIVTDHHTIGESIPDCLTVKPGQDGDEYKNTDLCGAGIAFKIAQALLGEQANELIDFACLATISDVVPLKEENRYIVKEGLKKINKAPRDCFKALLQVAEFTGEVTAQTVGFTISPRLNAAGRMDDAKKALTLLLTQGEEAVSIATELNELNKARQEAEKRILEEAEAQILSEGLIRKNKVLIVSGKNWDDGVIGICAARILEKYKRPAIVFTVDEQGLAKGSGRSIDGVNLYEMLYSAKDVLTQFGGHKMAAGMSIEAHKLNILRQKLNQFFIENYDYKLLYPVARYDAKATMEEITPEFCEKISLFEPCGAENPEITLRVDNCLRGSIKKIGSLKNHLKLTLQDETGKHAAIAFNYKKHNCDYFSENQGVAIIKPELNFWQGIGAVNLKIQDFKETENIKPRHNAELLTALFYSRLNILKTGEAKVEIIEDPEELHYMFSSWDSEDISGTLILCDHPEYASGCISVLQDEAPRFDISYSLPVNENAGYNSLVIGADIDKIDFTPYNRVIIYDMLNTGYADLIKEKAPFVKIYALKCGGDLFDSIFEEYKKLSREDLMKAYRQILKKEGSYLNKEEFLKNATEMTEISMPVIMVALEVFKELEFISVLETETFTVTVNRNAQKRELNESKFYQKILKCVNRKTI